ncbi:MAG: ABC transporter ATP-binding protein [Thermoprotei archaeon]|nr:MAG: ABC transporter ATP-binding protein [Thermoprotei archaeon]RLF22446.1 MAG: ABC transporter ATP-binding protein [Thermoprotei archaeon]
MSLAELLRLEDVWFSYDGRSYVLKEVNFSVSTGEVVSILGPNGSGKTTLIKLFIGLLRPSKGRIYVKGLEIHKKRVEELARSIGIVFQNPNHQLFELNVKRELVFALKNMGLDYIDVEKNPWVARLNVTKLLEKSPLLLSEGEKRRVALASVLVYQPDLLVLDEPTTGQDFEHKRVIAGIVKEYQRLHGRAVVVVTHDMDFAWEVATRFIILLNGQVIFDGPPHEAVDGGYVERAGLRKPSLLSLGLSLKSMGLKVEEYDINSYVRALKEVLTSR